MGFRYSARTVTTAAATSSLAANRRGILSMAGAMACFVANDTLVKYASQAMPALQLIFLRGIMSVVLVFAVAHAMGATARLREITGRWVVVRAALEAVASIVYLAGLFHLPIANATAINLASPLFMTVLAVAFLREKVGAERWLMVVLGFAGVVLVIQPGVAGFNRYALVCLLASFLQALRDLITRRIDAGVPAILITLATTAVVTILSGGLSLLEGWRPFGAGQLAVLALAATFLMGAYYLIVDSMRHGEMSLVAPFRYSGLLYALLVGYLAWGDVPDALAWCGIVLLVGSGVYALHGERRRARGVRARAVA